MKIYFTVLTVLLLSVTVFGYSSGPLDALANNPPDYDNCTLCHNSFALNSGSGTLSLDGLPANGFIPDETYNLVLSLEHSGAMRWGFEITVIYETGGNYLRGGQMVITDPAHTQISLGSGNDPDYAKHTSAGTYPGTSGPTSWQFDWTAPNASVDMVTFYFVGNAANNNDSRLGDYIYAVTAEVNQYQPQPPVVSDIPDQTVEYGESFATINLDDYVDDPDTPDDEITWDYNGNFELTVSIVDRVATINIPSPEWSGSETINFIATDPTMLEGEDEATFTVNPSAISLRSSGEVPDQFSLSQNFPNPFNPVTNITFEIAQKAHVQLIVSDINGRILTELVNDDFSPGVFTVTADLGNLPSGIYLYQINTEYYSGSKKMILLK